MAASVVASTPSGGTPIPSCGMSVPVSRSNIPPSPYGPAQAMMYVTQQPHQAQMAQINERERVRIAMINRQRQQQARSAGINKNGKRPLEPETKQSKQEFGALVPRRLQDSHGERVKFHFAFGETDRRPCSRCIAPDLMDAIHLGDKGFFLLSHGGIRYYIWRYAARLDNPTKGCESNLFGNIQPFFMSFPQNRPGHLVNFSNMAATYNYLYNSWVRTTANNEAFSHFFYNLAGTKGLSTKVHVEAAFKRIAGFFTEARTLWVKTPMDPDESLAYLRSTEEFWWDEQFLPVNRHPSNLHDPDQGVEIFYPHQVDNEVLDVHFGHLQRLVSVWQNPRQHSSAWVPNIQRVKQVEVVKPERPSWRTKMTPHLGQQQEAPLDPWAPEPTLWAMQAVEVSEGECKGFEFFDFDRPVEDGFCAGMKPKRPAGAILGTPSKRLKTSPSRIVESSSPLSLSEKQGLWMFTPRPLANNQELETQKAQAPCRNASKASGAEDTPQTTAPAPAPAPTSPRATLRPSCSSNNGG